MLTLKKTDKPICYITSTDLDLHKTIVYLDEKRTGEGILMDNSIDENKSREYNRVKQEIESGRVKLNTDSSVNIFYHNYRTFVISGASGNGKSYQCNKILEYHIKQQMMNDEEPNILFINPRSINDDSSYSDLTKKYIKQIKLDYFRTYNEKEFMDTFMKNDTIIVFDDFEGIYDDQVLLGVLKLKHSIRTLGRKYNHKSIVITHELGSFNRDLRQDLTEAEAIILFPVNNYSDSFMKYMNIGKKMIKEFYKIRDRSVFFDKKQNRIIMSDSEIIKY